VSTERANDVLSIKQVADRVGVRADTVRYYERVGLLPAQARTTGDHRRYDDTAVDRLRFIQGAQRLGLRLADIRELLTLREGGECPCEPAATLLRQRLAQVDEQITRLIALREDLRRFVDRMPADDCPEPFPGTWRPRKEVTT
jgi:DNA-binding transcriptional MerR regulator